ncbi:UdgX family uracil-DNA binding protein [Gluconacetobacter diazotrophicus]|nr:UdgX family uracil-DNA binding protein [Gluconacetobacter diazotrophicus]
MPHAHARVTLAHEVDFAGWRTATRRLVMAGQPAGRIAWRIDARTADPIEDQGAEAPEGNPFHVSRALLDLAETVIQARDPDRFALLYRLVQRNAAGERDLTTRTDDPDIARALVLTQAVRDDTARLRAHLELPAEDMAIGQWTSESHVLVPNARFLTIQRSLRPWAVSTPDETLLWTGRSLHLLPPGTDPSALPTDRESWEGTGLTLRPADLPRPALRLTEGLDIARIDSLPALIAAARDCLICPMARQTTQTVFSDGRPGAALMLVGEQPGDQEDRVGRPFVGPAGQLLDRTLHEAGITRDAVYVTNAVKHFRFQRRGTRRLHEKPTVENVTACAPWLAAERRIVAPRVLVMLGATAAGAVLGRSVTIGRERSRPIPLADGSTGLVTVHPSFLLRQPDEDARTREYARFVADLRLARDLLPAATLPS